MNGNDSQSSNESSLKAAAERLGVDPALLGETVAVRWVGFETDITGGRIVALGDAGFTFESTQGWKRFTPWSMVVVVKLGG